MCVFAGDCMLGEAKSKNFNVTITHFEHIFVNHLKMFKANFLIAKKKIREKMKFNKKEKKCILY